VERSTFATPATAAASATTSTVARRNLSKGQTSAAPTRPTDWQVQAVEQNVLQGVGKARTSQAHPQACEEKEQTQASPSKQQNENKGQVTRKESPNHASYLKYFGVRPGSGIIFLKSFHFFLHNFIFRHQLTRIIAK
jgi:hypothetical protein